MQLLPEKLHYVCRRNFANIPNLQSLPLQNAIVSLQATTSLKAEKVFSVCFLLYFAKYETQLCKSGWNLSNKIMT